MNRRGAWGTGMLPPKSSVMEVVGFFGNPLRRREQVDSANIRFP